ncbi:HlyD family efflux transporter periplasmic adaptor subunit [Caldisalinibacter kiritimatiensis]|uniref:Membrane-fusion protein n=1 Tax=Caldisalinibacter kiritimatiensis TaxID=1304284 RepID=R1CG43_9FIRM|nr:HlyD family efflux transporter periplasmic adaptor subunit [Caldisalinibacter kiritimatiensis]EOD01285.1 membrane-fusion protein [Caldisalinibacter kiritimatiensis]
MPTEKRKIKRKRKRVMRLLLVFSVVMYILLRMTTSIIGSNIETVIVENGVISVTEKTKGIIIKDEKVYRALGYGNVNYFKEAGDKVAVGTKIAEISTTNRYNELKEELRNIDERLKIYQSENKIEEIFKDDIGKVDYYIKQLENEISECIINGEYSRVQELKNKLNFRIEMKKSITEPKGVVGESIERLKKKKKNIVKELENLKNTYYADSSGVLSLSIDGLEEIYSSNKISKLTPDDFRILERKIINLNNGQKVNHGHPIFKISNNYKWYIIAKMNKESLDSLEEGKTVYIKVDDEEKAYEAKVYKINTVDKESLIIFKFENYFYKFIDKRYVDIEIIKTKHEGLKIPKTSIVDKNGIKGVYIKDISNIVKFRPIQIIGTDDKYAIVSEGEKINLGGRGKIEIKVNGVKEKKYTIYLFDKIIVNGSRVKEGQIIN